MPKIFSDFEIITVNGSYDFTIDGESMNSLSFSIFALTSISVEFCASPNKCNQDLLHLDKRIDKEFMVTSIKITCNISF